MPLLTSTRNTRHLGIDFRKFPVKTNKKLSEYHIRVPQLPHARRQIGEDFRKFSAETNEKN